MTIVRTTLVALCAALMINGASAQRSKTGQPDKSAGIEKLPAGSPALPVPLPPPPPIQRLPGSFLYIYSFLDIGTEELGPRMVTQLNQHITERFGAMGIETRLLAFADSAEGQIFRSSPETRQYGSMTSTTRSIPIGETIFRNLADETATGARYRLIVFPSNYRGEGVWQYYDIRWILLDTTVNREVWSYTSQNKKLTLWRSDEDSKGRARKTLDLVAAAMKEAGLL